MQIGRMVRRKARAAAAPSVFLLLVAYFLWSATQGAHGLRANTARQKDLVTPAVGHPRAARRGARQNTRVRHSHVLDNPVADLQMPPKIDVKNAKFQVEGDSADGGQ